MDEAEPLCGERNQTIGSRVVGKIKTRCMTRFVKEVILSYSTDEWLGF